MNIESEGEQRTVEQSLEKKPNPAQDFVFLTEKIKKLEEDVYLYSEFATRKGDLAKALTAELNECYAVLRKSVQLLTKLATPKNVKEHSNMKKVIDTAKSILSGQKERKNDV